MRRKKDIGKVVYTVGTTRDKTSPSNAETHLSRNRAIDIVIVANFSANFAGSALDGLSNAAIQRRDRRGFTPTPAVRDVQFDNLFRYISESI